MNAVEKAFYVCDCVECGMEKLARRVFGNTTFAKPYLLYLDIEVLSKVGLFEIDFLLHNSHQ